MVSAYQWLQMAISNGDAASTSDDDFADDEELTLPIDLTDEELAELINRYATWKWAPCAWCDYQISNPFATEEGARSCLGIPDPYRIAGFTYGRQNPLGPQRSLCNWCYKLQGTPMGPQHWWCTQPNTVSIQSKIFERLLPPQLCQPELTQLLALFVAPPKKIGDLELNSWQPPGSLGHRLDARGQALPAMAQEWP